jgi:hypothetical protein
MELCSLSPREFAMVKRHFVQWEPIGKNYGWEVRRLEKGYGWRCGDVCIESGASVADVMRYEEEVYDNELTLLVPMEYLDELLARDAVWLCKTKKEALFYRTATTGAPYKVGLSSRHFIAASDDEDPRGYLVIDPGGEPAAKDLEWDKEKGNGT